MFDNLKAAREMMKNMSPGEIKDLMNQAKDQQKSLEDMVRKLVQEEISRQKLISKNEVINLIKENPTN
jgi:uncharacterized protein YllA (UPF0747 family)